MGTIETNDENLMNLFNGDTPHLSVFTVTVGAGNGIMAEKDVNKTIDRCSDMNTAHGFPSEGRRPPGNPEPDYIAVIFFTNSATLG